VQYDIYMSLGGKELRYLYIFHESTALHQEGRWMYVAVNKLSSPIVILEVPFATYIYVVS
jgi:hypothetical protein